MVYPHLDCRWVCQQTALLQSGSSIPPGRGPHCWMCQPARAQIEERILVPASIYQWKATEAGREQALEVQLENRKKFQQAFSTGSGGHRFLSR